MEEIWSCSGVFGAAIHARSIGILARTLWWISEQLYL
uniref:Uncharacterized protein n=1 Tax=Picea sitchensis TaxID=3332 RepID=A9NQQ9_PICSI|nr:unknown [Picea sitchensis]